MILGGPECNLEILFNTITYLAQSDINQKMKFNYVQQANKHSFFDSMKVPLEYKELLKDDDYTCICLPNVRI